MMFVEGTTASLDRALFAVLFPKLSILPKESCRHVMQAVAGLRGVEELHWLRAIGIIDRDDRSDIEVAELLSRGILALPVSSIEAIYYASIARDAVATRQAETLGRAKSELINEAGRSAMDELRREQTKTHLVNRRCERVIRNSLLEQLASTEASLDGTELLIRIPSPVAVELAIYNRFLAAQDIDGILGRYPPRESGALTAIAKGLRFSNRNDYEEAFLTCVTKDVGVRRQLCQSLDPLASILND